MDILGNLVAGTAYAVCPARSPGHVVVIAVDRRVARWCAQPIETDRAGNVYRPLVIGPSAIPVITDMEQARQMPELAVLSAIAHGREPAHRGHAGRGPCHRRAMSDEGFSVLRRLFKRFAR